VHTKDGKDVTVSLKDKYPALAVVKSSMDEIKQGTFIGTATEPQPDGSLRAVEVVVFPDSLRGFAEGHYPWDLAPKSMMTNATIAQKVQKVDGETVAADSSGSYGAVLKVLLLTGPRKDKAATIKWAELNFSSRLLQRIAP
jgi:hypothetical protein